MPIVTLEQAQTCLPALIEAALRGEEVVITPEGQSPVKLVVVPPDQPQPRFGSARGKIIIVESFDEPLEEFKEYMG